MCRDEVPLPDGEVLSVGIVHQVVCRALADAHKVEGVLEAVEAVAQLVGDGVSVGIFSIS